MKPILPTVQIHGFRNTLKLRWKMMKSSFYFSYRGRR
jgi:hypothetical protein